MHVLLGLGPDESALGAFDTVLERVAETGDDLTVAVFGEPDDRELLAAQAHERLAESTVAAEVREVTHDPGSSLVELAESEGLDRIVLSGGKRSPLGKIQLHSVAEFVLLNAPTTVTLVR